MVSHEYPTAAFVRVRLGELPQVVHHFAVEVASARESSGRDGGAPADDDLHIGRVVSSDLRATGLPEPQNIGL